MDMDKPPEPSRITARHLTIGAAIVAAMIAVGSAFGGGVKPAAIPSPPPPTLPLDSSSPAGPQAPENQWIEWKAEDGVGRYQAGR